jgi:hypothetical protein
MKTIKKIIKYLQWLEEQRIKAMTWSGRGWG